MRIRYSGVLQLTDAQARAKAEELAVTGYRRKPVKLADLFRAIANLKRFRAIATRFEKTARNYLALIHVAWVSLWVTA